MLAIGSYALQLDDTRVPSRREVASRRETAAAHAQRPQLMARHYSRSAIGDARHRARARPTGGSARCRPSWRRVSTWADFETEAPEVAAVANRLWPGAIALNRGDPVPPGTAWFAIAYLATVRRDGGPRLHPFCPIIAGGRLFAAIPHASPKGHDLRRDPRCVIHAMPGPDDDELCIRATATEVTADIDTAALVRNVVARSGVGGMIESTSHHRLFGFDLQQVDVATWVSIGQPGTHALRRRWRAT